MVSFAQDYTYEFEWITNNETKKNLWKDIWMMSTISHVIHRFGFISIVYFTSAFLGFFMTGYLPVGFEVRPHTSQNHQPDHQIIINTLIGIIIKIQFVSTVCCGNHVSRVRRHLKRSSQRLCTGLVLNLINLLLAITWFLLTLYHQSSISYYLIREGFK